MMHPFLIASRMQQSWHGAQHTGLKLLNGSIICSALMQLVNFWHLDEPEIGSQDGRAACQMVRSSHEPMLMSWFAWETKQAVKRLHLNRWPRTVTGPSRWPQAWHVWFSARLGLKKRRLASHFITACEWIEHGADSSINSPFRPSRQTIKAHKSQRHYHI